METIRYIKSEASHIQGICVLCNTNPQKKKREGVYQALCQQCNSSRYAESAYRTSVKRIYGISSDELEQMLIAQDYKCKICGAHQNDVSKSRLFVDHCHTSGTVRGLLCHSCNSLLGHARESIDILKAAIEYLE